MKISASVLEGCKARDRKSQNELYRLLLPYLAAVCKRYLFQSDLIHDALQETFIQMFTHFDSYDANKGAFQTWAVRIAINASRKCGQKEAKHNTVAFEDESDGAVIQPAVLDKMGEEELLAQIRRMPRSYYEVFNMYVVDGLGFEEIAADLTISQELARQRLSRARKWIKEHLERQEANESARANTTKK